MFSYLHRYSDSNVLWWLFILYLNQFSQLPQANDKLIIPVPNLGRDIL